jgi:hypothetical protein
MRTQQFDDVQRLRDVPTPLVEPEQSVQERAIDESKLLRHCEQLLRLRVRGASVSQQRRNAVYIY